MQKIKRILILVCFLGPLGMTVENCASRVVYVRKAPPRVRVEVRPVKPFTSAVWMSGYWRWNGRQHVWVSGRWAKPKKGKVWVTGHWKKAPRGWHYVPGHWR